MHRTSFVPRLYGWASLFAALLLLIGSGSVSAQGLMPANFQNGSPEIQQTAATLTLVVGTTQTYMMQSKADLKRVENPNSKVLDVRAVKNSPNEVQLVAISPGRTRVALTDVKDRVELLDVVVISDRVKEVRELIARSVPTAQVTVNSTDPERQYHLSGTVLTLEDMARSSISRSRRRQRRQQRPRRRRSTGLLEVIVASSIAPGDATWPLAGI